MSIYFICDERRRRMKIGFTRGKDARQRLAVLQIGNVVRLVVARFIADAGHSTERWFHRHYSDRHIGGEWFRYCETMLTLDPPSTLDVASQPFSRATHIACRAFAAARAAKIKHGSNRWNMSSRDGANLISKSEAIAKYGVSLTALNRARTILVYGSPGDEEDVLSGRVSLSAKAIGLASKRIPKIKVAKRSRRGRPRKDEMIAARLEKTGKTSTTYRRS